MNDQFRPELGVYPYQPSEWAGEGVVPFGDDVLHTPTVPLEAITDETRLLARYMIDVMHARDGIGLAANQVGVGQRFFVHNLSRVAPQVIINPQIIDTDGRWDYHEGCLSMTLDGTWADTIRPKRLLVEALTIDGDSMRITADEILARVFMHEIDHLDGVVYTQRLSGTHRTRSYRSMSEGGVDTGRLTPVEYPGIPLS